MTMISVVNESYFPTNIYRENIRWSDASILRLVVYSYENMKYESYNNNYLTVYPLPLRWIWQYIVICVYYTSMYVIYGTNMVYKSPRSYSHHCNKHMTVIYTHTHRNMKYRIKRPRMTIFCLYVECMKLHNRESVDDNE